MRRWCRRRSPITPLQPWRRAATRYFVAGPRICARDYHHVDHSTPGHRHTQERPMTRVDATWHQLLDWTQGQPPSERRAALLLNEEGYHVIDAVPPDRLPTSRSRRARADRRRGRRGRSAFAPATPAPSAPRTGRYRSAPARPRCVTAAAFRCGRRPRRASRIRGWCPP